jgi:hypothetical protein
VRELLHLLREASHGILEALKILWMEHGEGGFQDLQGRNVGHHLEFIGRTAAWFEPRFPALGEPFGHLARVSRKPYGNIFYTASSTTEYVIRHCCAIASGIDGAFRDRTIRKENGLSEEEREVFRKSWKSLRQPFSNSGMLPTYGKCVELAAEVDWEYHRAVGLLPPEEKKPIAAAGTIAVFLSYSHTDEKLRKKLVNHLSQLKHEGLIRHWHHRKIGAGAEWEGQIQEHLSSAHIILLLVSSDFLASPYIHDVEVKRALERHDGGEARVIPVILRSCDWHSAPFGKLQALPTDGRPVTKWPDRDEAFTVVAKGIRAAVNEIAEAAKKTA